MLVPQDQERLSVWGKVQYAHRQVDEQPTKRSKKNDDKSAVVLLKKGDWPERGLVTDQGHDRSGRNLIREVMRNWDKNHPNVDHLMHGNWVVYFQDMTPPKSILRKCTDMQK